MKKLKLSLLLLCLAMALAFVTGCKDDDDEGNAGNTTENPKPKRKSKYTEREQGIIDAVKAGGVVERQATSKRISTNSEMGEKDGHYVWLHPQSHPTLHPSSRRWPIELQEIIKHQMIDWKYSSEEHHTLEDWSASVYPGAILSGNSLARGSAPELINLPKRRKVELFLQAISELGHGIDESKPMATTPPTASEVNNARTSLASKLLTSREPTTMEYQIHPVYSPEDLVMKTGLKVDAFSERLLSYFSSGWDNSKYYVMVVARQVLYSLSIPTLPKPPLGAFQDELEVDELKASIPADVPLTYVQSVSYGNAYYILYEADILPVNFEMMVHLHYYEWLRGTKTSRKNRFKGLGTPSIKALKYSAAGVEELSPANQEALDDLLKESAIYSSDNSGALLSYRVLNLRNNSSAPMHNSLRYEATKRDFQYTEQNYYSRPDEHILGISGIRIQTIAKDGKLLLSDTELSVSAPSVEGGIIYDFIAKKPTRWTLYKDYFLLLDGGSTHTSYPASWQKKLTFEWSVTVVPSVYTLGKGVSKAPKGKRSKIEFTIELDKASGTYRPVGKNREYFTENGGLIELDDCYVRVWLDWSIWADYVRMEEVIE